MTLHIKNLSFTNVRSLLRNGETLPELEFGLLKRHGDRLKWGTAEKSVFLDMATQKLEAKLTNMTLELNVRYFCHSKTVTADYLRFAERFNMKRCVLVIGNIGQAHAPWAELIQPAVDLFQREYNMIWIDIPAFATNPGRWFKYGPGFIRGALKFLSVQEVHVLACGVGGSLLLEMLSHGPERLARTHFIYNIDFPKGSKAAPFDPHTLEDSLRGNPVQMWFAFCDDESGEEGAYNRMEDGSPRKAYEAITMIQARLAGERRRGGGPGSIKIEFDDVLLSEKLNTPHRELIREANISRYLLLVAEEALLMSIATFFAHEPTATQNDMEGGLIIDQRARIRNQEEEVKEELPALRQLRNAPANEDRKSVAQGNRRRLDLMNAATLALMPGAEAQRVQQERFGNGATWGEGGMRPPTNENVLYGLRVLADQEPTPEVLASREEYLQCYRKHRDTLLRGFGAMGSQGALTGSRSQPTLAALPGPTASRSKTPPLAALPGLG